MNNESTKQTIVDNGLKGMSDSQDSAYGNESRSGFHISQCLALQQVLGVVPIGYVVELGSNVQAKHHLQQARAALEVQASSAHWSTELINPDYTATADNPKPPYTNQCGYLKLMHNPLDPLTLGELVDASKKIEKRIEHAFYNPQLPNQAKRSNQSMQQKQSKQWEKEGGVSSTADSTFKKVIIDIDILAILTESEEIIALKERYPFKSHEWIGLTELSDNDMLN